MIGTRVISMPSWELFQEQDEKYKRNWAERYRRIAIEAGVKLGWERWLYENCGTKLEPHL